MCPCVMFRGEITFFPLLSLFRESVDHQTGRERELGRATVKVHWAFQSGLNVTSGACSTWWEVIFWCKSGRIRSKRRDSQSINRQIRHGNCRLWLFPAHRIVLSALKLFILSKGKERGEDKSSEVGLSLPCLCKRSYALGSNAHKAPLLTLRAQAKLFSFVAGFTLPNLMLLPVGICKLPGNNRRRKFTAVNSPPVITVAVKSDCRIAA